MAQGVNKCIFVGNLGKDPEVKFLQSGTSVCNLRIAVTERRKDGDDWKDHTEWVDVVVFGKSGEAAGEYLNKGSQVYVDARVQTREYDDKEGNKRWRTEFIANQVVFLGSKKDNVGEKRSAAPASNTSSSATRRRPASREPQDDLGF